MNDWLEGSGRFQNDPQISNPGGTCETKGAADKKVFVFYGEKLNQRSQFSDHQFDRSSPCYKIHSSGDL